MGKPRPVEPPARWEKFLEHLEAARQLQKDWMTYGLDCVGLYVEDVDEDWWEKWVEEEHQSFVDLVIDFLKSDDWVAVRVRKQLANQSIPEIAVKLEKYLNLPEPERIFVIKDLLANKFINNELDEIKLWDLVGELLEKLIEIQAINPK
jgi:hypothetical protein